MATPNEELETTPVTVPPEQHQEVTPAAEVPAPVASAETIPADNHIVEALEKTADTLQKAEHTIVALKKKLKDSGISEGDEPETPQGIDSALIEDIVDRKVREALDTKQEDPTVQELATVRAHNAELIQTIKSKNAAAPTAAGNNQDRYNPEEDRSKKYTSADLAFLQTRADRARMPLNEYLKKHNL